MGLPRGLPSARGLGRHPLRVGGAPRPRTASERPRPRPALRARGRPGPAPRAPATTRDPQASLSPPRDGRGPDHTAGARGGLARSKKRREAAGSQAGRGPGRSRRRRRAAGQADPRPDPTARSPEPALHRQLDTGQPRGLPEPRRPPGPDPSAREPSARHRLLRRPPGALGLSFPPASETSTPERDTQGPQGGAVPPCRRQRPARPPDAPCAPEAP